MARKKAEKKTKRILLIEDEELLKGVLTERLAEEGFEVSGSATAEEAFIVMEEKVPDLILSDLVLLNVDGFAILEQLQNDPRYSDIPVLVLSNLGRDEDIERAKRLGAKGFLIKSNLSLEEIVKKVKKEMKK